MPSVHGVDYITERRIGYTLWKYEAYPKHGGGQALTGSVWIRGCRGAAERLLYSLSNGVGSIYNFKLIEPTQEEREHDEAEKARLIFAPIRRR